MRNRWQIGRLSWSGTADPVQLDWTDWIPAQRRTDYRYLVALARFFPQPGGTTDRASVALQARNWQTESIPIGTSPVAINAYLPRGWDGQLRVTWTSSLPVGATDVGAAVCIAVAQEDIAAARDPTKRRPL